MPGSCVNGRLLGIWLQAGAGGGHVFLDFPVKMRNLDNEHFMRLNIILPKRPSSLFGLKMFFLLENHDS